MLSVFVSLLAGNEGQLATALPRISGEVIPRYLDEGKSWEESSRLRLDGDIRLLLEGQNTGAAHKKLQSLLDFTASLHLLMQALSELDDGSGKKRRISPSVRSDNLKLASGLKELVQQSSLEDYPQRYLDRTIELAASIRNGNIVSFRRQVMGESSSRPSWTAWHLLLLQRAVQPLQRLCWTRLRASYISVPLPVYMNGSSEEDEEPLAQAKDGSSWLERLMLIDEHVQDLDLRKTTATKTRAARLGSVLEMHGLSATPATSKNNAADVIHVHPDAQVLLRWRERLSKIKVTNIPHPMRHEMRHNEAFLLKIR